MQTFKGVLKMSVRQKRWKRCLASLLSFAIMFSTLAIFNVMPQAFAATYDGAAAAKWARENYSNQKGVCATFAYYALKAGGWPVTYTDSCAKSDNSIRNQLRRTGGFAEYVIQQSGSGKSKTVNAYSSANNGKISVGDLIMVYVPASDVCQHVYVVGNIESNGTIWVACWNSSYYNKWTAYSAYENNGTNYQLVCFHYTGSTPPPPDPSVDNLGCSTAYAGWYRVKNSAGANVNQYHTKSFSTRGNMVAELPCNAYVYVSKATGQGSGQLGHITYQGVERYIAMNLFEKMSGSPIGSLDNADGGTGWVWVGGWAFDWDNCEEQLQIEVCLDDVVIGRIKADGERSDVNASYSNVVGSYHGFSQRVSTSLTGQHKLDVYAVNVGSGSNVCLGSKFVNIQATDSEGPTISNVQVSNVTNTGYDVSCTVTDPSGVDRVQFPTWTTLNGQDDLLSDWSVNSAARGTKNGDTWTFHVNIADHNNEGGDYLTHIHAYDKYGNSTSSSAGVVSIDVEPPVIRDIQVSNVTSKGYDVSCTVTDNVGVNRVVFPTWTDRNGQDDIASEWWSVDHFATRGTQYGDTWTFHVDIADHNHESGLYHTHIYAYDDAGNMECNIDAAEVVVPEPASTVTFDANGGTAEFDSKEVEYGDVLGVLPEAARSHYVFLGWYTDPEDGDRVTDQSDVNGSMTLYAHWVPAFGAGWQLEDGVLTIENDGAMEDYAAASDAPWFRLRSQIQSVVVSEGVTSLSSYAFYGCDELEEVSLPQSLCRIGSLAFGGCTKLSSIVIPSDVLLIGDYAFVGDDALQTITFEGHAPEIGVGAFSDVTATVIYKGNDQSWTEDIRQSYLGNLTWTSSV